MLGLGFCVFIQLLSHEAAASCSLPCGNFVKNVPDRPRQRVAERVCQCADPVLHEQVGALHGPCGGS